MKIHLKCCCGAEFDVESRWATECKDAANNWHEAHANCKPPQPNPMNQPWYAAPQFNPERREIPPDPTDIRGRNK